MEALSLHLDDRFVQSLPADPIEDNTRRQVKGACFSYTSPRVPSAPTLLHASAKTAGLVGLSAKDCKSPAFLALFSGKTIPDNIRPYAMCYGGHQFGHWAGQLGDGRAINLAEVNHEDQHWTLQLKGAGETPYSRSADGLAVLRSSIREHLCSEAMFHLGVPTSRSLSLMLTGDEVLRDVMYDGNPAYEKGAVVCRVARSFLRFGSFEIHAARGDVKTLKQLADYTIKHHFPEIALGKPSAYTKLFRAVAQRSLRMIIAWQRVGFVHGVMNTDNMSILGETIDYGPYGWLEGYDPNWTPNTTDRREARYRYGNQPQIMLWNLHKLANALYPLVEEQDSFIETLQWYQQEYPRRALDMYRSKLGLHMHRAEDSDLVADLHEVLQLMETDMTIFFRLLATYSNAKSLDHFMPAFYDLGELTDSIRTRWEAWLTVYEHRLTFEARTPAARQTAMNKVNPKYVIRNYMAQLAIDAADQGDYSLIEELYQLSLKPYAEQPEHERWFAKRPEWARHKVGCSMLSCSS